MVVFIQTKSFKKRHKLQDHTPTEVLPLMDLNVTVNVQTGHPNAMQMMALIRGKTRNYFVYSDSGQVSGDLRL